MEFDADECDLKWWRGEEGKLGKKGEWHGLGAAEIREGDGGSGQGLRCTQDGGSGDGSCRGCAARQQNLGVQRDGAEGGRPTCWRAWQRMKGATG
jgi:hypothetical protein